MSVHPPPTVYTRRSRRKHLRGRRRRSFSAVLAFAVLAAGVGFAVTRITSHVQASASCTITAGTDSWTLDPVQAQGAATISAVAIRMGLPDHAVTIALATSLQETKLLNLPYGDRDSVGLFQQRPSQGWGTSAQIRDPNYAAGAFYGRLVTIPGWRTLDVAGAAQQVQRSADGSAYAGWEPEARALARAFTGESAATFACSGKQTPPSVGAVSLRAATKAAVGQGVFASSATPAQSWRGAAHLMAQAPTHAITSISIRGERWTAKRGTWQPDPRAGDHLTFTVAPPAHR